MCVCISSLGLLWVLKEIFYGKYFVGEEVGSSSLKKNNKEDQMFDFVRFRRVQKWKRNNYNIFFLSVIKN